MFFKLLKIQSFEKLLLLSKNVCGQSSPRFCKRFSILEENYGADIINETFKCKLFVDKCSKTCRWVSYTFLQKPHSFKHFSVLEEKCCADIINGWRQKNNQQIFSVRQILKKSTQTFFVQAKTKNMTLFEDFFSCCMTSFVAKKQFGTGVASFFKLIEETDSQRQIHFCAGAWLEFKRFWPKSDAWRKKKITMHVLTRFYSNVYKKSKWETAETGGNLTFFFGYFLRR